MCQFASPEKDEQNWILQEEEEEEEEGGAAAAEGSIKCANVTPMSPPQGFSQLSTGCSALYETTASSLSTSYQASVEGGLRAPSVF